MTGTMAATPETQPTSPSTTPLSPIYKKNPRSTCSRCRPAAVPPGGAADHNDVPLAVDPPVSGAGPRRVLLPRGGLLRLPDARSGPCA